MSYNLVDPITGDLTRVAGNAANADLKDLNVYSTEEKIVGTWIDDKPIYRKTVEFSTSTLSAGENYVSHGLQNIELLMVNKDWSFLVNEDNNHKVTTWQFGNSVNTNATTISDYSCNIVWVDASAISIYIGSRLNPKKVIITFEYTKTTD